jgi:hypothetical protein
MSSRMRTADEIELSSVEIGDDGICSEQSPQARWRNPLSLTG